MSSDCSKEGSVWITSARIITAVIGSGVLSLPWAMAQLGWLVGPIVVLLFFFLPYYICTHQFTQSNNVDVAQNNLGETGQTEVRGWIQCLNMCGVAMGYTIAAYESMKAITPKCGKSYMIMFGAAQLILSRIQNLDEIAWLSMVAAAMSFTYSIIGIGLGIAELAHNEQLKGSLFGVSKANKEIWRTFQAMGEIVFAFMILPHIQGTVESPSSESTMRRAAQISVSVTTLLYMLYGCIGYAAFGDSSPKNLLTKPECGFNHPAWVLDMANAAVVVHLIIAYQAYGQPTFRFIQQRFEQSHLVVWTAFVITTTTLSIYFPYEEIPGLIVALGFWPSTVYYPVKMYIAKERPSKRSIKWWALQILSVVCLAISIAAAAGTAVGLVHTV